VPFTKEQRLKGLKKQLANLGYSISKTGSGAALPDPGPLGDLRDDYDMDPELEKRAKKQIIAWDNAKSVEAF